MLRIVAFVGGMVAGMVLLLVVGGVSRTPAATAQAVVIARSAPSSVPRQDDRPVFAHPVDPNDGSATDDEEADPGTRVDLQGDEVTAAVARYRFDSQGNIYETHAPHTEVPRLRTPQL